MEGTPQASYETTQQEQPASTGGGAADAPIGQPQAPEPTEASGVENGLAGYTLDQIQTLLANQRFEGNQALAHQVLSSVMGHALVGSALSQQPDQSTADSTDQSAQQTGAEVAPDQESPKLGPAFPLGLAPLGIPIQSGFDVGQLPGVLTPNIAQLVGANIGGLNDLINLQQLGLAGFLPPGDNSDGRRKRGRPRKDSADGLLNNFLGLAGSPEEQDKPKRPYKKRKPKESRFEEYRQILKSRLDIADQAPGEGEGNPADFSAMMMNQMYGQEGVPFDMSMSEAAFASAEHPFQGLQHPPFDPSAFDAHMAAAVAAYGGAQGQAHLQMQLLQAQASAEDGAMFPAMMNAVSAQQQMQQPPSQPPTAQPDESSQTSNAVSAQPGTDLNPESSTSTAVTTAQDAMQAQTSAPPTKTEHLQSQQPVQQQAMSDVSQMAQVHPVQLSLSSSGGGAASGADVTPSVVDQQQQAQQPTQMPTAQELSALLQQQHQFQMMDPSMFVGIDPLQYMQHQQQAVAAVHAAAAAQNRQQGMSDLSSHQMSPPPPNFVRIPISPAQERQLRATPHIEKYLHGFLKCIEGSIVIFGMEGSQLLENKLLKEIQFAKRQANYLKNFLKEVFDIDIKSSRGHGRKFEHHTLRQIKCLLEDCIQIVNRRGPSMAPAPAEHEAYDTNEPVSKIVFNKPPPARKSKGMEANIALAPLVPFLYNASLLNAISLQSGFGFPAGDQYGAAGATGASGATTTDDAGSPSQQQSLMANQWAFNPLLVPQIPQLDPATLAALYPSQSAFTIPGSGEEQQQATQPVYVNPMIAFQGQVSPELAQQIQLQFAGVSGHPTADQVEQGAQPTDTSPFGQPSDQTAPPSNQ